MSLPDRLSLRTVRLAAEVDPAFFTTDPLTNAEVQPVPDLSLTPANSSVELSGNYTIVMADAGPVGTDESAGQTRHWLVNGATVSNGKSCLCSSVLPSPHLTYNADI